MTRTLLEEAFTSKEVEEKEVPRERLVDKWSSVLWDIHNQMSEEIC